jgi:hypothetical protein
MNSGNSYSREWESCQCRTCRRFLDISGLAIVEEPGFIVAPATELFY